MRQYTWAIIGWLSVAAPSVWAEDWLEFRGPAGNGHATVTSLPTRWTATEHVAWKQPLRGEGWSSPVIARGQVLLSTAVPQPRDGVTDYSLRLQSWEAATGKPVWDVELFQEDGTSAPKIHAKNSHASPTPLVDGDRIYVHFGHEGTACVDWNGNVVWRNRTLRYAPVHGAGGSPVLVDGLLIFACDGAADPFIVALDAKTGEVRWKTPRVTDASKKFSFSTAAVIEVGGRPQIISPGSNMVCALDPHTGAEIWRVRYDGYSVIPKPVFGQGLVYVCTGYNRPSLLAIRPEGQGDVTDTHVAWTVKSNVPHTPSLLLVGGELYMVSDAGIATCLDAQTGQEVWQKRLGGNYSASPLYAGGLIYFPSEDGVTTVIKAAREYEVVATNALDERTFASYAALEGTLFLRTNKFLYRIQDR